MNAIKALKEYFGYSKFRVNQEEIINAILDKNNVLAVLPTGAGKSICYQIPSLISPNFSIVISPLIALMKDQVDSLNKNGEIAAFINSTMSFHEVEEVLHKISFGQIKLLYVAPERLENIAFAERIKNLSPYYLFVDEAHCISEWGHNFRPSYRKIKEFVDFVGINRISGFTATATTEVVHDITKQLGFKDHKLFVRGFERDNLYLNVFVTKNKKDKCYELIKQFKTPAIIYTASRKNAEDISDHLNFKGVNTAYYHAGLGSIERKKIQEDFLNDKLPVIAATNAFGMGIDKKDIRLIIHYNTPGSIENYYQEIGRAGRDGNRADVFLLHDDYDINIQNFFLSNSHPDKELIQNIYSAICDYGKIAVGNISDKEIPLNYDYISSYLKKRLNKGLIFSAIRFLENAGYLKLLSEYNNKPTLQFVSDSNKLKNFIKKTSNLILREAVLMLLREYGSNLFNEKIKIPMSEMIRRLDVTNKELEDAFTTLDNLGFAIYSTPIGKDNVKLITPRVKSSSLKLDYKLINESYIRMRKKIDSMVDYVFTNECRFKFILDYFGEDVEEYSCGKCDICVDPSILTDTSSEYVKELVLRTIRESNKHLHEASLLIILKGNSKTGNYSNYNTYGSCANYDKNDLKNIIQQLISEGLILRKEDSKKNLTLSEEGINFVADITEEVLEKPPEKNYEDNLFLFNSLRELRTKVSKRFLQTGYLICPDEVLKEIALAKPKTKEGLLSVKGFNNRMFSKFGTEILEVVNEYFDSSNTVEPSLSEIRAIPSNIIETYNLLKKGYSLSDIASLRQLSEAVISMQIETILEYQRDIKVEHLFEEGFYKLISEKIAEGKTEMKELKADLPEAITYPLIRIALAKHRT